MPSASIGLMCTCDKDPLPSKAAPTSASTGASNAPPPPPAPSSSSSAAPPPPDRYTTTNGRSPPAPAPPPPSSSSSAGAPERSINPDNKSGQSLLSQILGVKLKSTEKGRELGITKGGRRTRGRRAKRSHRRTRRMLGRAK
jgi:hypothetical protein